MNTKHRTALRRTILVTALVVAPLSVFYLFSPIEVFAPEEKQHTVPVVTRFAAPKGTRIFLDGFETKDSGGGEPPDWCASGSPFLNPLGWARIEKSWTDAFSYGTCGGPRSVCERNRAVYPAAQSYPTPLGTNVGTDLVIPFTPNASQSVNLYWDGVQSRPQVGYQQRPAKGMFVAISQCPGVDLRPGVQGHPDPMQRPGCRRFESLASLVWTTMPNFESDDSVCKLEAGKTYYLNVSPVDPHDGLTPGEHSCSETSPSGCDVGAVTQVGS